MKKNLVFIIMICLFCSLVFVGCHEIEEEKQIPTLSTPTNVFIDNEILKWDYVKNATSYSVVLLGESNFSDIYKSTYNNYIEIAEFNIYMPGIYKFQVNAVGAYDYNTNKQKHNDSAFSSVVKFERNPMPVIIYFNPNYPNKSYVADVEPITVLTGNTIWHFN